MNHAMIALAIYATGWVAAAIVLRHREFDDYNTKEDDWFAVWALAAVSAILWPLALPVLLVAAIANIPTAWTAIKGIRHGSTGDTLRFRVERSQISSRYTVSLERKEPHGWMGIDTEFAGPETIEAAKTKLLQRNSEAEEIEGIKPIERADLIRARIANLESELNIHN